MAISEMLVILAMVTLVRVVLEMLFFSASNTPSHGEAPTEMVMLSSGACHFGSGQVKSTNKMSGVRFAN